MCLGNHNTSGCVLAVMTHLDLFGESRHIWICFGNHDTSGCVFEVMTHMDVFGES